MTFTDIFVRRPVLASVISLMILVLGTRAVVSLDLRQFPKLENTVVTVSTTYPGASAELIKGFITTPLQQAIAEADGIDYMSSSSKQGVSSIDVTMKLNYDAHSAVSEIQSKVASQRNVLPDAADDPVIQSKTGESTALMYIAFYSDTMTSQQITDYLLRVVRPQLQAIPGVARAQIFGNRFYAMRVWLDPRKMTGLGVTASDVRSALQANNYLVGAGSTKNNLVTVDLSTTTDINRVEDFRDLVVRAADGIVVRVGDVAELEMGAANYDSNAWYKTNTASYIGIEPTPGANPLTVARAVRDLMPELRQQMPDPLKVHVPYDASEFIEQSIQEVFTTLAEAVAIVLVVIFLSLGSIRAAIVPAVAVPLSIIGAAFLMLLMEFSLNTLTLLAMVLAIGLVVDDAIVVVENVHRHMIEGKSAFEAALVGARELRLPIIAMTTTLIAVYAPIGFMSGLVGSLFTEFAYALSAAVLISGIVALTLSPMLSSKVLREGAPGWFERQAESFFNAIANAYRYLLHHALSYIPVTIFFGFAILLSNVPMFLFSQQELAPNEDQAILFVHGRGPEAANLNYTETYAREIFEAYETVPEYSESFFILGFGNSPNTVFSGFKLTPSLQRSRSQSEIQPELQQKLNDVTGFQTAVFPRPSLPGSSRGLPLQFVVLTPENYADLDAASDELLEQALATGQFMFLQKSVEFARPKTTVVIDRDRAGVLGVKMEDIGRELATLLGEGHANWFNLQGRSYKVIPQASLEFRGNKQMIESFYVRTSSGRLMPLSTLVSFKESVEPSQLTQFQQLNSLTLQGLATPGVSMGGAIETLEKTARDVLPPGYTWDFAGVSRQYAQQGNVLLITFFVALLVIYLVLAAQFESWRDPLVIMMSVPMSIAGALVFVTLGFASINIYTQIGLITLIGLIAKNGILIVEFANQLQIVAGLSKREAIERGAMTRLRPIIMTTVSMMVAMVPLLLATGPGAVSRSHIGLVIIAGLGIGTVFTLFVVPAFYMLLARDHKAQHDAEVKREQDLGLAVQER